MRKNNKYIQKHTPRLSKKEKKEENLVKIVEDNKIEKKTEGRKRMILKQQATLTIRTVPD